MDHEFFMHECLRIAEGGRHHVGNGALVGSVLVRKGKVIASGHYKIYGDLHAERSLLEKFDQKIDSSDTLYVNLEPCCHTGKTPPCTDIILQKGVKKVVFGMQDPDSRVSGTGIKILRDNGVEVIGPVLRAECEFLNRGFISVREKDRPFITLKSARAKDGSISNSDASPRQITSKEQDVWSHTNLRFPSDAILVGVGTILSDDPQLNTRLRSFPTEGLEPYRIILDPHFRIPESSKVLTDANASRTIVVTSKDVKSPLKTKAKVVTCPMKNDQFDLDVLLKILITPEGDFHGITSILVEGGQKTWESFKEAGLVDVEVTLIGE